MPECRHGGRQGDSEMVKCCICMSWFHPLCCGDSEEDAQSGIFNCPNCRTLIDCVTVIENQLSESIELNKQLLSIVNKTNEECASLRFILSSLTKSNMSNSKELHVCDNKKQTNSDNTDNLRVTQRHSKLKQADSDFQSTWSASPTGPKTRPLTDLYPSSPPSDFLETQPTNASADESASPQSFNVIPIQKKSHSPQSTQTQARKCIPSATSSPRMQRVPTAHPDRSSMPLVAVFGNSMVRGTGNAISNILKNCNTCV